MFAGREIASGKRLLAPYLKGADIQVSTPGQGTIELCCYQRAHGWYCIILTWLWGMHLRASLSLTMFFPQIKVKEVLIRTVLCIQVEKLEEPEASHFPCLPFCTNISHCASWSLQRFLLFRVKSHFLKCLYALRYFKRCPYQAHQPYLSLTNLFYPAL